MRVAFVLLALSVLSSAARADDPQQAYRLSSGATRVAMLPVACGRDMPKELCAALDESLGVELGKDPRLEVVTPRDMEVMMGAQQLMELQACDGDGCFQADALAQTQAAYLVAVVIGRIGRDALITARVVDLRRGTVLDRDDVRVLHQNESDIDEATRALVQNILVRRGLATPLSVEAEERGTPAIFWTGAAVTTVGVAGVAVGGVFGAMAAIEASGLKSANSITQQTFDEANDRVRGNALIADVAVAAGGAAVVAGVVMIIVGSL